MRTYEGMCWNCKRSRALFEHKEKDPATSTLWYVITCTHCKTNVDIKDCYEEAPPDAAKNKSIIVSHKGRTIRKFYGL